MDKMGIYFQIWVEIKQQLLAPHRKHTRSNTRDDSG